jgi:hypothetical protein
VLQGSLLCRYAPPLIAAQFVQTRVVAGGGWSFGTLPAPRRAVQALVERAVPE